MFQLSSAKKNVKTALVSELYFFTLFYLIFHVGIGMSILIRGELDLSYLIVIVYGWFLILYFFLRLMFVIRFLSSVVCHPSFVTCCLSFFFSRRSKYISYPQTKIDFNNLNFGPVFIHIVFFFHRLSLVNWRWSLVVWCLISVISHFLPGLKLHENPDIDKSGLTRRYLCSGSLLK